MEPERGGCTVRSWPRRRWLRPTGVVLVLLGLVLLGGSTVYFVYGFKARSDLGGLSYAPSTSSAGSGFLAYDSAPEKGVLPSATRIRIPAIEVDSAVEELGITDLGDSRAYETPKHVVGHIPESANAGENGTAWFFGHLESPIRGEGSVFRDLPRIPELLHAGEEVYAIFDSEDAGFLYRLTSSEVLPEQALQVHDAREPTIRLVTCVPALYYDFRLVIWGELVGVKRG